MEEHKKKGMVEFAGIELLEQIFQSSTKKMSLDYHYRKLSSNVQSLAEAEADHKTGTARPRFWESL